jgi:hypothetical protein
MKQLIILLLAITTSPASQSQSTDHQMKMLRINTISDKILMQKKDPARVQIYALYSNYFTENNIYPNADAIDLIDAYNKDNTYDDIQSKRTVLKLLQVAPVKIDAGNYNLMRQNARQIELFHTQSASFYNKVSTANGLSEEIAPPGFKNELLNSKDKILPDINTNAENIPALQMDFFLNSLIDINRLMDLLTTGSDPANTRLAISELLEDFTAYKVNTVKIMQPHVPSGSAMLNKRSNLFLPASYTTESNSIYLAADGADLPNANIYVYTRDASGSWDQQPKPNAFNVYYGPNGLKYSLTPGCDTLSFFRYHPSVPASTLPVILAKGNFCFVLQDVNTNQLFLRPDINLRDNKVVDDQQLIKLCFKVENAQHD